MTDTTPRRPDGLHARRVVALVLTTLTYLFIAALATWASFHGVAPEFVVAVIGALAVLETLLVLAFFGSAHALWAGLMLQTTGALLALLAAGAVDWTRAVCFSAVVTLLTYDWLVAFERPARPPAQAPASPEPERTASCSPRP